MKKTYIILNISLHEELRNYTFFEIGNTQNYYDDYRNKVYVKNYFFSKMRPVIDFLMDSFEDNLKINLRISGSSIYLLEKYCKEALDELKKLVKHKGVELICEPYHGGIVQLFSKKEYLHQVNMHKQALIECFDKTPKSFRSLGNTFNKIVDEATSEFKVITTDIELDSDIVYKSDLGNCLVSLDHNIFNSDNKHISVVEIQFEDLEKENLQLNLLSHLKSFNSCFLSELITQPSVKMKYIEKTSLKEKLQISAFKELVALEDKLKVHASEYLLNHYRKLTNLIHFHNMSHEKNKSEAYDVYIRYINIVKDLNKRVTLTN